MGEGGGEGRLAPWWKVTRQELCSWSQGELRRELWGAAPFSGSVRVRV